MLHTISILKTGYCLEYLILSCCKPPWNGAYVRAPSSNAAFDARNSNPEIIAQITDHQHHQLLQHPQESTATDLTELAG